jgi:hypothetical protein
MNNELEERKEYFKAKRELYAAIPGIISDTIYPR